MRRQTHLYTEVYTQINGFILVGENIYVSRHTPMPALYLYVTCSDLHLFLTVTHTCMYLTLYWGTSAYKHVVYVYMYMYMYIRMYIRSYRQVMESHHTTWQRWDEMDKWNCQTRGACALIVVHVHPTLLWHVRIYIYVCVYIHTCTCTLYIQYRSDARYKARVYLHAFARGGKHTCTLRQIHVCT